MCCSEVVEHVDNQANFIRAGVNRRQGGAQWAPKYIPTRVGAPVYVTKSWIEMVSVPRLRLLPIIFSTILFIIIILENERVPQTNNEKI